MARNPLEIQIRILQNGHQVAECTKAFSRGLSISITSDYQGDLSIPFYPLTGDIHLFEARGKNVFLRLDQPCSGFLKLGGNHREVSLSGTTSEEFAVSKGDYGSLSFKDLRVLFQVGYAKSKTAGQRKRTKEYDRGPFPSLLVSKQDRKFMGIGLAASLGVLLTFYLTISAIDTKIPRKESDLGPEFILPFMNENHLILSPETLQSKLDRRNYLDPTIRYVTTMTRMIMGYEYEDTEDFLFDTVEERYASSYRAFQETSAKVKSESRALVDEAMEDPTRGTFFVPAVIGESYEQRLTMLVKRFDTHHRSLRSNLESRRLISDSFEKDEPYDWVTYHQNISKSPFATEFLSRIRVFKGLTNEEAMYAVAAKLGYGAYLERSKILKTRETIKAARVTPIYVEDPEALLSFFDPITWKSSESKVPQIRASEFGKTVRKIVREPLIGRIKPELITNTIRRKRFELQVCYDLALRRNESTRGTMDWRWTVDTGGRILDITLRDSTIRDRRMIDCVRRKMSAWRFPKPKRGSVEVNHSFSFTPRKG